MNDELIKHELDTHEKRLNNHGERLDKLEQEGIELKTELKNLCESLKSLTNIMKIFVTTIGGALVSFLVYVIQYKLFK